MGVGRVIGSSARVFCGAIRLGWVIEFCGWALLSWELKMEKVLGWRVRVWASPCWSIYSNFKARSIAWSKFVTLKTPTSALMLSFGPLMKWPVAISSATSSKGTSTSMNRQRYSSTPSSPFCLAFR